MIITRIQANNLLKYERLDINLPEQGIIAVSGQNESGKSSIGEVICFALFGRTFSIAEDALHKLVRWGQHHCNVSIDCKLGEETYQVSRFIDSDGHHSAKLVCIGQEESIARGVVDVADVLVDLIGYDYGQYIESFYLAQREITTPHPHSQSVKVMAGIEPLEKVANTLQNEVAERQELMADIQQECAAIEDKILLVDASEERSVHLQQEQQDTSALHEQMATLIDEIQENTTAYTQNQKTIQRLLKARGFMRFWRFIFFILLVVAGAGILLLSQGDNVVAAKAYQLLDEYLPVWRQAPPEWFQYAAFASGALFLISWIRVAVLTSRIRRLRTDSGKLVDSLLKARAIDIEIAEYAEDTEPANESTDKDDGLEEDLLGSYHAGPVRPEAEALTAIQRAIAVGEASSQQVLNYVDPEVSWLKYVVELLQTEIGHLKEALVEEEGRLHRQQKLQASMDELEDRATQISQRIILRETALDLLRGAITQLSDNFNHDIKDLVGKTLPLFTGGHYEHLQINEQLQARVFSADKRDFMDLEEASNGTQRQIMLALRLALSQKLLSRMVRGKQFIFLDEPFAFFDEERTRKGLLVLPQLAEQIGQIWIVAQSFPAQSEVEFTAHLVCERGKIQLAT